MSMLECLSRRVVYIVVIAALLMGVVGGADPLTREELLERVLTVEEVRELLEQEDWVVRVPIEPLFTEPEGSITARAIYGLEKISRLLLLILYYFADEESAQSFYAQEPEDGQEIQEEPTREAREQLELGQAEGVSPPVRVDEVRIAISQREDPLYDSEEECEDTGGTWDKESEKCLRDQHRFLRFRWDRFVVHFEINTSRALSPADLRDEKLIKLAKAQFEILVKGRSEE